MASDGLLSLRWNNHRISFMQTIASLRNKDCYSDITLACDGKFYSVHKLVLSTCSDYFVEILNRTQCKHPVIVLKDIRQQDLEALLNYMYLGEVNVVQNELACLIKAAECLRIKGLAVPDEPVCSEEDPSPDGNSFSEPRQKKRKLEGDSLGAESNPSNKRNTFPRNGELNISGRQNEEKVQAGSCTNQLNSNKNINESSLEDQHEAPSTDFPIVIKEETPIKYENEDGITITDAVSSNKSSISDSACAVQRTDFSSNSGEMRFKSSLGDEDRMESQNVGLPQQYPLQPQTFEDVVSQALPGPSLQSDGSQGWDSSQKRDSGAFNLQGFPDQESLPHHQQGLQAMGSIEESFPNMRGSVGSEGNINPDPCNVSHYMGDSGVLDDPRLDMDTSRHAREWRCMYPECGYVTDRESWLKQHFRRHTGEKPFSCPFCSYRSAQKGNLNVHIKRVHLIEHLPNDEASQEMLPIT